MKRTSSGGYGSFGRFLNFKASKCSVMFMIFQSLTWLKIPAHTEGPQFTLTIVKTKIFADDVKIYATADYITSSGLSQTALI